MIVGVQAATKPNRMMATLASMFGNGLAIKPPTIVFQLFTAENPASLVPADPIQCHRQSCQITAPTFLLDIEHLLT